VAKEKREKRRDVKSASPSYYSLGYLVRLLINNKNKRHIDWSVMCHGASTAPLVSGPGGGGTGGKIDCVLRSVMCHGASTAPRVSGPGGGGNGW
jgi:hypothetical protein